jgi:UDP-GlcNAc:undecaprenyl-phosphate/decaprenyl-phosphate GlcNAc-1-phosphate transferase
MRLGHGPRRAVLILCLWTALASAAALIPTYTNRGNALVPIALAGLALVLFTVLHPRLRGRYEEEDDMEAEHYVEEVVHLADRRRARGGSG